MANGDTDGSPVHSDSRGMGWKGVAAVSLVVLAGGLILAGWLITNFDLWPNRNPQTELSAAANGADQATSAVALNNPSATANSTENQASNETEADEVAAKVEALEKQVAQIGRGDASAAIFSAAPFTTNQGGVATALRARRAIENGVSLGYIENQLGERFGDRFPQAIDAIQKLARTPVTVTELRDDFARNGELMIGRGGDASLWDRVILEFDELFLLRQRGEPSTSPSHILQRAKENIANGDVKAAIEEVQMLSENDSTAGWLQAANRYQNAKDALDQIERAALSAPAPGPVLVTPSANPLPIQESARP